MAKTDTSKQTIRPPIRHTLIVRLCHWTGSVSMICMILSGWQIYNASPLLPFKFSHSLTLGGWLGGAIAWHLSAMWGLLLSGAIYVVYGLVSGHFGRALAPRGLGLLGQEIGAALRFRLGHDTSSYNAIQRVVYSGVLVASILAVISGFAIWKPVQLGWLIAILGDYPLAREIHFATMLIIAGFLGVHLALVVIVPRTLYAMLTGRELMQK